MQSLLVEQHRDAESGLLHGVVLYGIDQRHRLPRIAVGSDERIAAAVDVAGTGNLSNACREGLPCLGGIEIPSRGQNLFLAVPQAGDLRNLLLERHAREQVLDALIEWCGGVLIERRTASLGRVQR